MRPLCLLPPLNALDSEVNRRDFYRYEEVFEKNTTLMYRPPEMIELFLGYPVNEKVDVWMLGCVLFVLLFFRHPFEEASKLAIVNCAYRVPKQHQYSPEIMALLGLMLTANPDQRVSAFELNDILAGFARDKRLLIPEDLRARARLAEEQEAELRKPSPPPPPKKQEKQPGKKPQPANKQPLMELTNEWGEFMKASVKGREYRDDGADFSSFGTESKPAMVSEWGTSGTFANLFRGPMPMPTTPRMDEMEESLEGQSQMVPYFAFGGRRPER